MKSGDFRHACLGVTLLPKVHEELFVHVRAGLESDDLSFCQFPRMFITLEIRRNVESNLTCCFENVSYW